VLLSYSVAAECPRSVNGYSVRIKNDLGANVTLARLHDGIKVFTSDAVTGGTISRLAPLVWIFSAWTCPRPHWSNSLSALPSGEGN